jgi:hypothetical protein
MPHPRPAPKSATAHPQPGSPLITYAEGERAPELPRYHRQVKIHEWVPVLANISEHRAGDVGPKVANIWAQSRERRQPDIQPARRRSSLCNMMAG